MGENGDRRSGFKVELKFLQKDYNSVDCWSIIAKQISYVGASARIAGNPRQSSCCRSLIRNPSCIGKEILDPAASLHEVCMRQRWHGLAEWSMRVHLGPAGS